ncbi:porin [Polaromonas sp.]|uniref:porin n=1 Tax=Polaromonas sp. TaxID=1869339 RepID=UPI002B5CF08E|nr:porin [Polaromonas sp.]HQS31943.1 porin [Polaromonas sp.]HQS91233.1 porin [Polaromonas sp.]
MVSKNSLGGAAKLRHWLDPVTVTLFSTLEKISMKKTLIALAALTSIAGVAQAQSSVTLYGIADAFVGSLSSTTRTAGVSTKTTNTVIDSGGLASPRFGLRGVEDLGGGLKAVFALEGGILVDTGAGNQSGGGLFSRQAFVGVNGGFGTVTLGRHLTAYDALRGATNYSDNALLFSFSQIGAVYGNGVADYTNRTSNSLAYTSPSFGGFSGALVVGTGEDKTTGVSASRNNSFHLKYANGPLLVGYAYQNERFNGGSSISAIPAPGTAITAATGERDYNLFGASYDFGVAKITGSYQAAKQKNSAVATNNGKDQEFQAGVTVPFGAAAVSAGYVRSKSDNTGLRATGYSLLGTYSLSKRTSLYAGGLSRKFDLAAGANGTEKFTAVVAGLRHNF